MRIELTLTCRQGSVIPMNYQYEISSWIYKTLYKADSAFASALHEKGYPANSGKRFKLFTFSRLELSTPFTPLPDHAALRLDAGRAKMTVSFLLDDSLEHFVIGLFQDQKLGIGTPHIPATDFMVRTVQMLPRIQFSAEARFSAISPICVSVRREEKKHAQYLHPTDPEYLLRLMANLEQKYVAAVQHDSNMLALPVEKGPEPEFMLLSTPKKQGVILKAYTPEETQVIGYSFDFSLRAAPALLETGYLAGFGNENAQGFGCTKVR